MRGRVLGAAAMLCAVAGGAAAAEALVAVAANFAHPAQRIEAAFENVSPHRIALVIGSTGKLYAQIAHGAPFDVLLAADRERPRKLEAAGLSVPGSRRTYALGRLALWSADGERIGGDGPGALRDGLHQRLAIANPRLAPYGAAAIETLRALGLYDANAGRLVMGENVGQAHALVATGAAELGFVAASYLMADAGRGSSWAVPAELHGPVRQDAVLLRRAADNRAALAFMAFLVGERARGIITASGYDTPANANMGYGPWKPPPSG